MSELEVDNRAEEPVLKDDVGSEEVENGSTLKEPSKEVDGGSAEEDEDDDGMGLFGDDEDEEKPQAEEDEEDEEMEEQEEQRELKTIDVSLIRHSKSHYLLKDQNIKLQVPTYIGIDSKPFDPNKFSESVEDHADTERELDDKVILENTIRWRYSTNQAGDVYRQSNSQVIEWDDGSLSLRLGGEIFDLRVGPNEDNFLVMTHDEQDILQTQDILTHVAKIVPTSTSSLAHKRLTKSIARRQALNKQHKMKSIVLTEDPELRIKALERQEEENFRLRRRAELKRLQEEEKMERGSPGPSRGASTKYYYNEDEEEEDATGIDVRKNEYDDDDGFIDDDEEEVDYDDEDDELDLAAERLRKVKEAGAAKYADDEEEPVSRKKRRIISDDDDE